MSATIEPVLDKKELRWELGYSQMEMVRSEAKREVRGPEAERIWGFKGVWTSFRRK